MAGKIPFRTIQTEDRDLNMIQDNVRTFGDQLQNTPFFGGTLPNSSTPEAATFEVALTSGQANLVAHKLGRPAQYFILLGQDTNTNVWRVIASGPGSEDQEKNFIDLRCGSNCNIKVWVN